MLRRRYVLMQTQKSRRSFMEVQVLMRRQQPEEPMEGTLKAWMLVNGRPKGKNLLSHHRIVRPGNARQKVEGRVRELFSGTTFVPTLEIEFTEDGV